MLGFNQQLNFPNSTIECSHSSVYRQSSIAQNSTWLASKYDPDWTIHTVGNPCFVITYIASIAGATSICDVNSPMTCDMRTLVLSGDGANEPLCCCIFWKEMECDTSMLEIEHLPGRYHCKMVEAADVEGYHVLTTNGSIALSSSLNKREIRFSTCC